MAKRLTKQLQQKPQQHNKQDAMGVLADAAQSAMVGLGTISRASMGTMMISDVGPIAVAASA